MSSLSTTPIVLLVALGPRRAEELAQPLKAGGIQCVTTNSRREALELCARCTPDLVIVSFEVLGLGLTADLLTHAGARQTAVVLDGLSSVRALQAYRSGFEHCLSAPLQPRDVERLGGLARVWRPASVEGAELP